MRACWLTVSLAAACDGAGQPIPAAARFFTAMPELPAGTPQETLRLPSAAP